MNKLRILSGIAVLTGVMALGSCVKDDDTCKVCHYNETDGSSVSLGQLCGNEYKTVESSGYVSGTGHHSVTCE